MKLLHVNILYKQGSTGRIVEVLHEALIKDGIISRVCYGSGPNLKDNRVYKLAYHYELSVYRIWAHLTGLQYASGFLPTLRLIHKIKIFKPDIVHLHCPNGYFLDLYYLLKFLKLYKIRTVITLHAEFFYTGSCGHAFECEKWKTGCGSCPQLWDATHSWFFDRTSTAWKKMKYAIQGMNLLTITAVSPWLRERAITAPILKGRDIITIKNGIDTKNIFKPTEYLSLKKKLGIKNEKIILHVTARFNSNQYDLKGGKYIIDIAESLLDSDILFIIIGSNGKKYIRRDNVIYIGQINDQHLLAQFYSMSNLSIITSKRETFSMPVIESLSCGTPVVGFKAGGPESIALDEYTEFVDYGDTNTLKKVILKWIDVKGKLCINIREDAKILFSIENMKKSYEAVYRDILRLNK